MIEEQKTYLYLTKSPSLEAYKIGIANAPGARITQHLSHDWELVSLWQFDNHRNALSAEKAILNDWTEELKASSYLTNEDMPQKGYTETVDLNDLLNKIREKNKKEKEFDCELSENNAVVNRIESVINDMALLMIEGIALFNPPHRIVNNIKLQYVGTEGTTIHQLQFIKELNPQCGCESYGAISRKAANPPIPLWYNIPFRGEPEKRYEILELVLKTLTQMQQEQIKPCKNTLLLDYYGYTSQQIAERMIERGYSEENIFPLTILVKALLEDEFKFNTTPKLFKQERARRNSSNTVSHWTYGDKIPIEREGTLF